MHISKFNFTLFFLSLIYITGCATRTATETKLNLIPSSEYYTLIQDNTQKKEIYDGFMNVLNVNATLLTTKTALAQVDHNANVYQYSEVQYQNEKSTANSNLTRQTDFFLSFFVPEKKYDDLAKKSSKWKIFLDVAGQRYEPKIIKIKGQLAELQSLYPFYSRWSTPYRLVFPVSTAIVENGQAKITITGPMASTELSFNNQAK